MSIPPIPPSGPPPPPSSPPPIIPFAPTSTTNSFMDIPGLSGWKSSTSRVPLSEPIRINRFSSILTGSSNIHQLEQYTTDSQYESLFRDLFLNSAESAFALRSLQDNYRTLANAQMGPWGPLVTQQNQAISDYNDQVTLSVQQINSSLDLVNTAVQNYNQNPNPTTLAALQLSLNIAYNSEIPFTLSSYVTAALLYNQQTTDYNNQVAILNVTQMANGLTPLPFAPLVPPTMPLPPPPPLGGPSFPPPVASVPTPYVFPLVPSIQTASNFNQYMNNYFLPIYEAVIPFLENSEFIIFMTYQYQRILRNYLKGKSIILPSSFVNPLIDTASLGGSASVAPVALGGLSVGLLNPRMEFILSSSGYYKWTTGIPPEDEILSHVFAKDLTFLLSHFVRQLSLLAGRSSSEFLLQQGAKIEGGEELSVAFSEKFLNQLKELIDKGTIKDTIEKLLSQENAFVQSLTPEQLGELKQTLSSILSLSLIQVGVLQLSSALQTPTLTSQLFQQIQETPEEAAPPSEEPPVNEEELTPEEEENAIDLEDALKDQSTRTELQETLTRAIERSQIESDLLNRRLQESRRLSNEIQAKESLREEISGEEEEIPEEVEETSQPPTEETAPEEEEPIEKFEDRHDEIDSVARNQQSQEIDQERLKESNLALEEQGKANLAGASQDRELQESIQQKQIQAETIQKNALNRDTLLSSQSKQEAQADQLIKQLEEASANKEEPEETFQNLTQELVKSGVSESSALEAAREALDILAASILKQSIQKGILREETLDRFVQRVQELNQFLQQEPVKPTTSVATPSSAQPREEKPSIPIPTPTAEKEPIVPSENKIPPPKEKLTTQSSPIKTSQSTPQPRAISTTPSPKETAEVHPVPSISAPSFKSEVEKKIEPKPPLSIKFPQESAISEKVINKPSQTSTLPKVEERKIEPIISSFVPPITSQTGAITPKEEPAILPKEQPLPSLEKAKQSTSPPKETVSLKETPLTQQVTKEPISIPPKQINVHLKLESQKKVITTKEENLPPEHPILPTTPNLQPTIPQKSISLPQKEIPSLHVSATHLIPPDQKIKAPLEKVVQSPPSTEPFEPFIPSHPLENKSPSPVAETLVPTPIIESKKGVEPPSSEPTPTFKPSPSLPTPSVFEPSRLQPSFLKKSISETLQITIQIAPADAQKAAQRITKNLLSHLEILHTEGDVRHAIVKELIALKPPIVESKIDRVTAKQIATSVPLEKPTPHLEALHQNQPLPLPTIKNFIESRVTKILSKVIPVEQKEKIVETAQNLSNALIGKLVREEFINPNSLVNKAKDHLLFLKSLNNEKVDQAISDEFRDFIRPYVDLGTFLEKMLDPAKGLYRFFGLMYGGGEPANFKKGLDIQI